jgi:hypothetical protein
VLATEKFRLIKVRLGKVVTHGDSTVQPRKRSTTGAGIVVINKIRGLVGRHFNCGRDRDSTFRVQTMSLDTSRKGGSVN